MTSAWLQADKIGLCLVSSTTFEAVGINSNYIKFYITTVVKVIIVRDKLITAAYQGDEYGLFKDLFTQELEKQKGANPPKQVDVPQFQPLKPPKKR
ncbi:hypothetical protein NIES4071_26400 [Calothrix sp. NIES-4071]|nr:hypothetical protein NIES4071_26400 [Calothrix sp. NIES-4071]BAZ56962.1 hypothetical protein NIES4105_26340 [Calothrix sp. NIES-4105]